MKFTTEKPKMTKDMKITVKAPVYAVLRILGVADIWDI